MTAHDIIAPWHSALRPYLWGPEEAPMFHADAFRGPRHDRRIDLSQPLPTLTASYRIAHLRGWKPLFAMGVPAGRLIRWYTESECAKLQGFPAAFLFGMSETDRYAAYHQLGNAVPPPLAFFVLAAALVTMGHTQLDRVRQAWDTLVAGLRGAI